MATLKAYRNSPATGWIHEIAPPSGVTFYGVWHTRVEHQPPPLPVASGTTSIKFFLDPTFPGEIWSDADFQRGDTLVYWANDLAYTGEFIVPATGGQGTDTGAGGSGAVTKIVAGANVTISPVTGVGDVTVSAASSGGGGTLPDLSPSPAGTVGDATHVAKVTVNAKGLITAASAVAIAFPPPGTGGGGTGQDPAQFASYVQAAFAADTELNWLGGDVTINAPIVLSTTVSKGSFGIRGNGAKVTCAFNDPTKHAISIVVPNPSIGVAVRNWSISDFHFGGSGFKGAIYCQCWTNQSWIYAFKVFGITCDGHAGHAIHYSGSVFECDSSDLTSSGGLGVFRATERGAVASDPTGADGDRGLPSAMTGSNWRCRDFNGDGVFLDSSTPYREPFDLRINEGYIVTGLGPGCGVNAPAGLTEIQGVGFEFLNNVAIFIGYRGGRVIRCQASNPVAGATLTPGHGMAYLLHAQPGTVLLDGSGAFNEGSGSGIRLAKLDDISGGQVFLNPTQSSLTGADCDWNGPNSSFHIVQYGSKP